MKTSQIHLRNFVAACSLSLAAAILSGFFITPVVFAEPRYVPRNVYMANVEVKQAANYAAAGNLDLALSRLQKAIALDPTNSNAYLGIGMIYARKGKNKEALDAFQKASVKQKEFSFAAYTCLATFYESLGEFERAKANFELLRQKALLENDDYSVFVFDKSLETLQKELQKKKGGGSDSDYFDESISKRNGRWPDWKMPLKVYIEPGSTNLHGYKSIYDSMLRQAFKDWERSSSKKAQFIFVNRKEAADIECYFSRWASRTLGYYHDPGEGGITIESRYPGVLSHVVLMFRTTEHEGTLPRTDNMVMSTFRHEVAHALGVDGHSCNPNDVMFATIPFSDRAVDISDRDRRTLEKIYAKPISRESEIKAFLFEDDRIKIVAAAVLAVLFILIGICAALASGRKKKKQKASKRSLS